jgi:hypothetical protein
VSDHCTIAKDLAVIERTLAKSMLGHFEFMRDIVAKLKEIRAILCPAQSARLTIKNSEGVLLMPATIAVGGTGAIAVFTEWSLPNGGGVAVPPITAPSFSSSNPSVASVDLNGNITAVSAGEATITGEDPGNGLSATDTVTVTASTTQPPPPVTAQSATLVITANPPAAANAALKAK